MEISTTLYDDVYELLDEWDSCKRIVPHRRIFYNYTERDFLESKAFEIRTCIFIWDESRLDDAKKEFADLLTSYKTQTVIDILTN